MSINDIHGYTGYVQDKETALNYANARMYNPTIGRFMAKDTLRVDGLNRYLYTVNNPVNAVDPDGHDSLGITGLTSKYRQQQSDELCGESFDHSLDLIQNALDIIGIGVDAADAVNAIISLLRGDVLNAVFNMIAFVPMIGSAISLQMKGIFKAIKKGGKFGDELASLISKLGGYKKSLEIINGIGGNLKALLSSLPKHFNDAIYAVSDSWFVKTFLSDVSSNLKKLTQPFSEAISTMRSKIDDVVKKFSGAVEGASNLTSKNIRFTQDSIASTFKNGSSVDDLIHGLKSGNISPDDIPAIRIFEKDGVIYSLDNRRLHAFKEAGIDNIKTVWATAEEIADEAWKFTTKNGGETIRVRGK